MSAGGLSTVLVTGPTGVVGAPLVERLPAESLVCLRHATAVPGARGEQLRGDVTRPRLGLSPAEYARLAERIDVVVHCAASTRFDLPREDVLAVNVEGTRRVLRLASDAGARLVAVSTAFVRASNDAQPGWVTARHYLDSKRRAEALVRESDLDWHIVRPSVVVGDPAPGAAARLQGFGVFMRMLLRGELPVLPAEPDDAVDFVPSDVLAEVLAAIAAEPPPWELSWVTAGAEAWRPQRAVDAAVAVAARHGLEVRGPRLLPAEVIEREVGPRLFPTLSRRAQRRYGQIAGLAGVVVARPPFESTLPALRSHYGRAWPLRLDDAIERTVGALAEALAARRVGEAVA